MALHVSMDRHGSMLPPTTREFTLAALELKRRPLKKKQKYNKSGWAEV